MRRTDHILSRFTGMREILNVPQNHKPVSLPLERVLTIYCNLLQNLNPSDFRYATDNGQIMFTRPSSRTDSFVFYSVMNHSMLDIALTGGFFLKFPFYNQFSAINVKKTFYVFLFISRFFLHF